MAKAAPYYRVPVVIFAIIVGGLYVYAKAGGSFFPARTQVTPASGSSDDVATPRIQFMMGSKSAPAFEQTPAPPPPPPVNPPAPRESQPRVLFPGSKSQAVVAPADIAPTKPVAEAPVQVQPVPQQRTILPGSKSAILVDPSQFTPSNSAPPQQTAPQQRQQQLQQRAAPRQQPAYSQQQPAPNYNNRVQPRNNTNGREY